MTHFKTFLKYAAYCLGAILALNMSAGLFLKVMNKKANF